MKGFQAELHESVNASYDFDANETDNFPAYFGAQIEVVFDLEENQYGFHIGTYSTGGRIAYADYSGESTTESKLRNITLGGIAYHRLTTENSRLALYSGFSAGIVITKYTLLARLELYDISQEESKVNFRSLNAFLSPSLKAEYKLFDPICLTAQIRYEINITGKLLWTEDDDAYLLNNEGDEVKADWSGLRVGLGVTFRFNKRNEEKSE